MTEHYKHNIGSITFGSMVGSNDYEVKIDAEGNVTTGGKLTGYRGKPVKINIQEAYEATRKFNQIASNLVDNSPERVDFQLDLIQEELSETFDGMMDKDSVAILDGACDLFVTVAGLMQKLEAAGFDVEEALKRVCDNNLSKFPVAANYSEIPEGTSKSLSVCGNYFIIKRNSDGKVVKPTNFVSVDIAGLAPEGYFA